MISIEYDGHEILDYLSELQGRLDDLSPVLSDIGEYGVETTKQRFDTSTSPDGSRWAPNTEATIFEYLGRYSSSYRKDGRLSSSGAGRAVAKKPLVGETHSLMSTIFYQLLGSSGVEWGSPMEYSAMQQFGGRKSEFPNLWGDIPARPYLGISAEDETALLDIVASYLSP